VRGETLVGPTSRSRIGIVGALVLLANLPRRIPKGTRRSKGSEREREDIVQ